MNPKSVLTILILNLGLSLSEDYYQLLGIARDADNREIRKAFKKLALKLHPDKNDAEDAHQKFLKITRAYEILKDEETRKKYDVYGEEGFEISRSQQGRYQSWTYYHEDFGIYDDDPEIVTLDSADFQRGVLESHDMWFINFYSPSCGHCHDLAPAWRTVAKQLEGVIRIGAVNCQEELMLCRRQGITGYPTIKLYTVDEGTKEFQGRREEDDLMEFVGRFLPERVVTLWPGNYDKWVKGEEARAGPWLMMLCSEESVGCPDPLTQKLVGASLGGLTSVGLVDCDADGDICRRLRAMAREENEEDAASLLFFPDRPAAGEGQRLAASLADHQEMTRQVLDQLPGPVKLDGPAFQEMRRRLAKEMGPGWLVQFIQQGSGESAEYKKLVPLVPRLRVGRVDCAQEATVCRDLHLSKFPSFVVFKVGGDFEIHYGKPSVQDVAAFARLSVQARTLRTLASGDFPDVITSGEPVFIDFFAPWCPPCMNLLPEFRKASTLIGGSVHFGTVDCTVHHRICNQHGINAYPTTIFFNQSRPHRYQGGHDAAELADFVQDVLRPTVVDLTGENFYQLVGEKSEDEVWLVDYFAPWCGPCQQLAPHWRTLGRLLEKMVHIKLGKVDCDEEAELCHRQGVRSYPTIRLYPLGSRGASRYTPYSQYHRDAQSLYQWVHATLPSMVESLTPYSFQHQVLRSSQPWLVEFYAPWCSHCVEFAPDYEQVALNLKGVASVGKVNCDKYRQLCSQAHITGYPTIRFYRGADKHEVQDYYSENISSREPSEIVRIVEESIKQSQLPGAKPVPQPKSKSSKSAESRRDEL